MQLSRTTKSRFTLLAMIGTLVLAIGSPHGNTDRGAKIALRIDDALESAKTALFGSDAPATVDLGDGKSRVPLNWRANFEGFATSDRARAPASGGVVFVGSSTIEFWSDLETQFSSFHALRRGLAGATMADCTRYVDRLILPSAPRLVVVYAGDNDLAAGTTPERIVADFTEMVDRVHRDLPSVRFVFVSIKPSPAREALMPAMKRTNALMASYVATDRRLDFVDVYDAMLDGDQRPRRELFRADGLHMKSDGYALWHDRIAPHLN
jgi:lysophospholipase L1-like esterase